MTKREINFSCATCKHMHEFDSDAHICRRYPPGLYTVEGKVLSLWPVINDVRSWWCGEHEFRKSNNHMN